MHIDVTPMVRPRAVAVIGASAKRSTQGNVVLGNLKSWGYGGRIVPVHPQAGEIDGLAVVNSVATLGDDTDVAIVAIPAAQVPAMLRELEASPVRSAIVFSNGFTAEEEADMRAFGATSRLIVHGPNCMGLVNFNDSVPLYPSRPSLRLKPGRVALVAQSGSAAISVMNSTVIGLSKVVTVGSEFTVSAADYIRWFADDPETQVVGVVAESIKSARAFAAAAEAIHAAGKSLIVLKVGRSDVGVKATQAHTGALVSSADAYDAFFRETNIATVADYDELVASLECAAAARPMVGGTAIGIVGISGGQTALACDVAEAQGVAVAAFAGHTQASLRGFLPGTPGHNPVDFGAVVNVQDRKIPEALEAVIADESVGAVVALQDTQESLNPATLQNYMNVLGIYAARGKASPKPLVVVSPTSENVDPGVRAMLADHGVPLIRGLHAGLKAVGNLALGRPGPAGAWAKRQNVATAGSDEIAALKREVAQAQGTLGAALSFRLLRAYGIPLVKAIVVRDEAEALARAGEVGFPMVVKVASARIQHRSDVGGVVLGVADADGLRDAIRTIAANVGRACPDAGIDGYELQAHLAGGIEAMAGFTAAAPFGQMVILGSGGTLVELLADRAVGLAPFDQAQARAMLDRTRLAKVLGGYRNLVPQTDMSGLIEVAVRLSRLAADFDGLLAECDINPVLVARGTGDVRVVDALFVRA